MSTEKQFYLDAETCIEELLQRNPTTATFLGDHRWDDKLSDSSPAAVAEQRRWVGAWLEKFEGYDTGGWSKDAHIDRTLMIQVAKSLIRTIDKVRGHERYPGNGPDEARGHPRGVRP